jgi:hypothetical protein
MPRISGNTGTKTLVAVRVLRKNIKRKKEPLEDEVNALVLR